MNDEQRKSKFMHIDAAKKKETDSNTTTLTHWTKRLVISLTILAWCVLVGMLFWLLGRVAQAIFLLVIGALLAYTIYPLVKLLQRVMPRPLAIIVVYLLGLGLASLLLYYVIIAFVEQVNSLIHYIQALLNGDKANPLQPFLDALQQFGVTKAQLRNFGQQIINQLESLLDDIVLVIRNVFNIVFNTLLTAMLSIYFLLSGPRVVKWLRQKTPLNQRKRVHFLLDTFAKIAGGYIRGTLLLATIISTLTGVGIALIGVPYAFLLAVLAFILEFIPVIGIYITGTAVVLLALTQGWVTGFLALGIVLVLQLLENNVLAPRIVGQAVGISPIINIFALVAGTNLFGIAGAFLATPVAGLSHAFIQALWSNWKTQHPEQFPEEEK